MLVILLLRTIVFVSTRPSQTILCLILNRFGRSTINLCRYNLGIRFLYLLTNMNRWALEVDRNVFYASFPKFFRFLVFIITLIYATHYPYVLLFTHSPLLYKTYYPDYTVFIKMKGGRNFGIRLIWLIWLI